MDEERKALENESKQTPGINDGCVTWPFVRVGRRYVRQRLCLWIYPQSMLVRLPELRAVQAETFLWQRWRNIPVEFQVIRPSDFLWSLIKFARSGPRWGEVKDHVILQYVVRPNCRHLPLQPVVSPACQKTTGKVGFNVSQIPAHRGAQTPGRERHRKRGHNVTIECLWADPTVIGDVVPAYASLKIVFIWAAVG